MKLGILRFYLGLFLFCCGIWGVVRREIRSVFLLFEKEVVLGVGAVLLFLRFVRCFSNFR